VAAGGDGTVREVASGLLRSNAPDTVLGVLPVGTGNDFATQIGVSDADAALAALTGQHLRQVDVIEVRHASDTADVVDHALLFAATGFAVDVLRHTSPRVKRVFGRRLSYSIGFFRALIALRSMHMRVRADGRDVTGPLFHVCAGNAEWAGGGAMRLSPGARLDDRRLELCVIQALGRLEALRCFPMLVRGTFPSHPKVRYFGGEELSVSTEVPMPLALDGDVLGRTPATFRVLPGALCVLAPTGVGTGTAAVAKSSVCRGRSAS
jgi:YegS/Rv2252/BmrU family lipid kinase